MKKCRYDSETLNNHRDRWKLLPREMKIKKKLLHNKNYDLMYYYTFINYIFKYETKIIFSWTYVHQNLTPDLTALSILRYIFKWDRGKQNRFDRIFLKLHILFKLWKRPVMKSTIYTKKVGYVKSFLSVPENPTKNALF